MIFVDDDDDDNDGQPDDEDSDDDGDGIPGKFLAVLPQAQGHS